MNEIETVTEVHTFEPLAAWLPMKYPRRGGFPSSIPESDPSADLCVDEHLHGTWVVWELDHAPDVDEYLLAARRHRQGDTSPLGAAALFRLLTRQWYGPDSETSNFADHWVSEFELAGAVEVMLEASNLRYEVKERPRAGPRGGWNTTADIYVMYSEETPSPEASAPLGYVSPGKIVRDGRLATQFFDGPSLHVATRLRALLVAADDTEYKKARLTAQRLRTNPVRSMTATFLFPTERAWSDEVFLSGAVPSWYWRIPVLASVSSAEQLNAILADQPSSHWVSDPDLLAAVVDGVGVSVAGALADAFDSPGGYGVAERSATRSKVLELLVAIPTDDAFALILERVDAKGVRPVLLDAMNRYPRRAFRLLAYKNWLLFDRHARAHPELARDMADELPPSAIARIDSLGTDIPVADHLPSLLVSPRWGGARKRTAPVVISGLSAPEISEVVWLPGELEELKARPHEYSYTTWEHQKQYLKDSSPHIVNEWQAMTIFLLAPDELARPLLTEWPGTELDDPQRVVQRFELEALPLMLQLAWARPGAAAPYLLQIVDIEVARIQATALATRKTLRKAASEWLFRHADDTITLLTPDAVGSAGPLRDHAVVALRALGRRFGTDHVCSVAAQYGPEAEAALRVTLEQDPMEILPAKIPRIGQWADLESLPPVLTADRSAALPSATIGYILTMCAISTPDNPYPGLAIATQFCDRPSLAAAGWELFERWWGAGAPSKDNWIVLAQGFLGDDSTVDKLVPLIRRWPGEGGTARAQAGLDALALIGSSRSLTELNDIARRMKFKSLKAGAAQRVTEVAESLGLDQEQLADRIVPGLGLSEGLPVLDYGGRTFTVELTESLLPYVVDVNGKASKSLPKPGASDDPVMAEAARTQFTTFKREIKSVATDQIKRLNRAMVTGRRWSGDEFSQYLLGHPLVIHLVRRLLWASFGENGAPTTVFRVAEDNTFADVEGQGIQLPDGVIGLVHPAHIPDSIGAWSQVFRDYEILQPFSQLGRLVYDAMPDDLDGRGLARFTGVTATPSQALRLTYRGWEPVWENPASWGQGLLYQLSDSVSVLLGLEPGMGTGSPYDGYPDQTLASVDVRGGTLAEVDRATVSELLADLTDFAS